jgi:preprotein translocase subunit SecB
MNMSDGGKLASPNNPTSKLNAQRELSLNINIRSDAWKENIWEYDLKFKSQSIQFGTGVQRARSLLVHYVSWA